MKKYWIPFGAGIVSIVTSLYLLVQPIYAEVLESPEDPVLRPGEEKKIEKIKEKPEQREEKKKDFEPIQPEIPNIVEKPIEIPKLNPTTPSQPKIEKPDEPVVLETIEPKTPSDEPKEKPIEVPKPEENLITPSQPKIEEPQEPVVLDPVKPGTPIETQPVSKPNISNESKKHGSTGQQGSNVVKQTKPKQFASSKTTVSIQKQSNQPSTTKVVNSQQVDTTPIQKTENGGQLPKTAGSSMNYVLSGILFLFGGWMFEVARKMKHA